MYGTNIFGIGMPELFFIAILALIVLGPQRLPGVIREVGKFIRQVRSLTSELTSQFSEELALLDEINPQKIIKELVEEPDEEDAEQKEAEKKTTAKSNASKSSTATKVKKPTAGTKPALGETESKNTEEKDSEEKTAVEEEADTSKTVAASDSDNADPTDTEPIEDDTAEPSVIEEAEAVAAAKLDQANIENRIAPPSMDGAASALRGKSTTKVAEKPAAESGKADAEVDDEEVNT